MAVDPTTIADCLPAGIPLNRILYLGGPNIAAEVWRGEYATARLCGSGKQLRTVRPLL